MEYDIKLYLTEASCEAGRLMKVAQGRVQCGGPLHWRPTLFGTATVLVKPEYYVKTLTLFSLHFEGHLDFRTDCIFFVLRVQTPIDIIYLERRYVNHK